MMAVITKQAIQCLLWVNMCCTTETVKEFINLLDKLNCSQVFAAKPSWKRY
jgi:hypothetical protein